MKQHFDTSDAEPFSETTQRYDLPLRLPAVPLQDSAEVVTLRRQLAFQQGLGHRLQRLLISERETALRAVDGLRARIAELEDELAQVKIRAGFERLTVTVTGRSYADVASGLTRAAQINGEELVHDPR